MTQQGSRIHVFFHLWSRP